MCKLTIQFLKGGERGTELCGPPLTIDFGEMESCSDSMIIGMPQLVQWGLQLGKTEHGQPYVEFPKYGIKAQVEREQS